MFQLNTRWTYFFVLCLVASSRAVVNSGASDQSSLDGPPGLIDIKGVDDLIAEASGN